MPKVGKVDIPSPMAELNTTPLIDVMLVLLVMFIITLPIQTHAVKLDLPTAAQPPLPPPKTVFNELEITDSGSLLWNGMPVSEPALRQYVRITQQMDPVPELHLRPGARTRYEIVDRVLAVLKREHVQKLVFVGNERFVGM
jgi:biopolymer transport protein ExbD